MDVAQHGASRPRVGRRRSRTCTCANLPSEPTRISMAQWHSGRRVDAPRWRFSPVGVPPLAPLSLGPPSGSYRSARPVHPCGHLRPRKTCRCPQRCARARAHAQARSHTCTGARARVDVHSRVGARARVGAYAWSGARSPAGSAHGQEPARGQASPLGQAPTLGRTGPRQGTWREGRGRRHPDHKSPSRMGMFKDPDGYVAV